MSTVLFNQKTRFITRDADGVVKMFRCYPRREGDKWNGKGCQILSPDKAENINITWNDEPVKAIEHKAIEICDFSFSHLAVMR